MNTNVIVSLPAQEYFDCVERLRVGGRVLRHERGEVVVEFTATEHERLRYTPLSH